MKTKAILVGMVAALMMFACVGCGEDCEPMGSCDVEVYEYCQTYDDYNGDWRFCYIETMMSTTSEEVQPTCDAVLAEIEDCCGSVDDDTHSFCLTWVNPIF